MPNLRHQKTSSAKRTPLLSRGTFFKKIFWKYFQVTNEIAIVLDRRGRIVFLNKTGRKILGVKGQDALGKNWFRHFLPRRVKASTRKTFQRLMRGGIKNIEYFTNPILDARGNERLIYWHNVVLKDENGKIEGTLSSGEDITEREQAESATRESEERYRVLFERNNDACFIADVLTRRLIDCNVQTERLTGYTRRHLLTLRADDLHPPSEVPKAMRLFRKMAAGRIISAEVKIRCRDGSMRLARVKATLLMIGGKKVLLGVFRDATERRRAEDELRDSERKYRALFDRANDAIFLMEEDRFVDCNSRTFQIFGCAPKDIIGKTPYFFSPSRQPDGANSKARALHHIKAALKGIPQSFEWRHKKLNGKFFDSEVSLNRIELKGKPFIQAIVRDVTERKQVEQALRQSEKKYKLLFEESGDAIFVADAQTKILVDCNKKAEAMTGYARRKILSMRADQLHPPELAAAAMKGFLKQTRRMRRTVVTQLLTKNKKRIPVSISASPLKIGGRTYLLGAFRDISEQIRAELQLKQFISLEQATLESTADGILVVDRSGKVADFNSQFLRLWRIPQKLLASRDDEKLLRFVSKQLKDPRAFLKKIHYLYSHPAQASFDVLEFKDGRVWERYSQPQKLGGRVIGRVWSFRDVTQREKTERELLEVKRKLEYILGVTRTGVDVIDRRYNLQYVDPAWQKLYGNPVGRKCYEYFMRRNSPCPGCGIPRALRTHRTVVTEEVLVRENNRVIEVHTIPFKAEDGEWMVGEFNVDITERKKAEEAIVEGRRQLRQIIDAVPHMIFAKDSKGCFLLVNEAVGRMYGKKPASLVGLRLQDVHSVAAEARQFLTAEKEVLKSGNPVFRPDEVFTDKCGKEYILETIRLPFKMAGRTDPVILGVSKDVTQQRKIEKFRGEIIGTVSHEFRTPLSIEKEGVKLLLDEVSGQINPDQRTILEAVMRGIDRLAGMVDKMLDISRIEAGKMAFKKKVCDLTGVVRNVMAGYKVMARGREALRLEENLPDREVKVFADPDRIGEVLGNLLDNSLKFTRRGTISVTLKVLGKKVRCEVRDTGVGMSPEQVRIMFEKFRQFSRIAGPGPKGLGLGLPIAREIIQKHHGRIWAESKLGKGTRVMFVLPLYARKGVRK